MVAFIMEFFYGLLHPTYQLDTFGRQISILERHPTSSVCYMFKTSRSAIRRSMVLTKLLPNAE